MSGWRNPSDTNEANVLKDRRLVDAVRAPASQVGGVMESVPVDAPSCPLPSGPFVPGFWSGQRHIKLLINHLIHRELFKDWTKWINVAAESQISLDRRGGSIGGLRRRQRSTVRAKV